VLQSGAIAHSGSAREIAKDPALVKAYLGEHGTVS
jgi:ABC-type branched-subunit amino acid transport system ATPase component